MGCGGIEGIRIIRSQPFSSYLGPWGIDSGPFSYSWVPHLSSIMFSYYILFPWFGCAVLCCAVYFFFSSSVGLWLELDGK